MRQITSKWNVIWALIFIAALFAPKAWALEIKEIESKTGVKALLVEDYTLPLISLSYAFKGGTTQDLAGKAGTVRLMSALIDEGAGDLDSVAFRSRLEELAIDLSFSSSKDYLYGGLRTIRSERAEAFNLLKMALNEPHFDSEDMERMRDAIRTGIIRSRTSPVAIASKSLRETLFDGHSYAWPASGDERSIDAVSRDDVVSMHGKLFARDTLVVGVVGAISEEELIKALDEVFGTLPTESQLNVVSEIEPVLGRSVSIDMPSPKTNISLVYPGLKREDPQFFTSYLLSHILGGGTFSSRLHDELRERRGLVYSVYSAAATPKHSAYLTIGTSTRADNRDKAIEVIREEVRKVAEKGVTQEELDAAKKYVYGAYAINNLDTSAKIAQVLVAIQNQDLGLDYIDKRKDIIEKITLEEINLLAKRLLTVEPTQVVVGPATE